MYTRFSKIPQNPSKVVCNRSFKNFDCQAFLQDIKYTDWSEVYMQVDADFAAVCLTKKINAILDVMHLGLGYIKGKTLPHGFLMRLSN